MKKRKFVSILMLCLILTSVIVLPVQAAPAEESEGKNIQIACYDMERGGTQVFEVVDENGERSTITVTQLPADTREADGVYQIEQSKLGAWTAGYKIKIANDKITSAYGKYYETVVGKITEDVLSLDSSKQVTYSFVHTIVGISYKTGVCSSIKDDKIYVTVL